MNSQHCGRSRLRLRLSRILRGEILFKTVLSRPWRYERYWQSICGNSVGPRACHRRNWRTAPRSTVPISAHLSEAYMRPVLTLWTGWHGFSVLRRPIFSSARPRLGIKRNAGVNLALNWCLIVRSRTVHFASRAERPGEPRAPKRVRRRSGNGIGGKMTNFFSPKSVSRATGFPVARLSTFQAR